MNDRKIGLPERPGSGAARKKNDERIEITLRGSSLGRVLIARRVGGVCAVLLGDEDEALRAELRRRFRASPIRDRDDDTDPVMREVMALLESPAERRKIPLELEGTEFQRRVWAELQQIPPGHTATYSELAVRIGRPTATRAVGSACGANPVAVIVPCHRALRTDGGLGGYRWGLDRKRLLLAREAEAVQ